MQHATQRKQASVFSPIATRTRRSSSVSNSPSSELPLKKRRSSIKRKSLAETLQYLDGSTPLPQRSLLNNEENEPSSSKKLLPNIGDGNSEDIVSGVGSVYKKYAALEAETVQWRNLLQKYQQKDADARENATKFLQEETQFECSTESGTLDCKETVAKIECLEHRLTRAVKVISRAAEVMVDLKERLQIRDHTSTSVVDNGDKISECNPKDLLEQIFFLNEVVSNIDKSNPADKVL